MTFYKILREIFWFVFRKHSLNAISTVTPFSLYTLVFLKFLFSALTMPCKQFILHYFGQNKGCHGILQLFSVKFIFLDKVMNSGKNVKIRGFQFFLV